MNCHFCPELSEVECGASVRKPIVVLPAEIRVGDLYCTAADEKECLVLSITEGTFERTHVATVRYLGQVSEPVWILKVEVNDEWKVWHVCCPELPVLVKRKMPCEIRCCWKHYREVSDGAYRCQDHWMIGTEEGRRKTASEGVRGKVSTDESTTEKSPNIKSTSRKKQSSHQDNRSSHKNWKRKVKSPKAHG